MNQHIRLTRPCIICSMREGRYECRDGFVCTDCMPVELLPHVRDLEKFRIVLFRRANPGWVSCRNGLPDDDPGTTAAGGDRSMVITTFDDIVLADELVRQIRTAERIDIVVSFIKSSGLNLIIDALRSFTCHGRLRVVSTVYMGATDLEAVEALIGLPNTEVRMELYPGQKRLHAKAFLFDRPDGGATAFVGSANISASALTTGEEWEAKLREADVPDAVEDVRRTFESLWSDPSFTSIGVHNIARLEQQLDRCGRSG